MKVEDERTDMQEPARTEVRRPLTKHDDTAVRETERRQKRGFRLPAIGLLESAKTTLRALLSKAVTVHYPEERVELPERTRGVIGLLEENCTVCMLCAKECPCWCIYIEGHKVEKPGRRKPVNELDRFAIDYGLCMYCGICVEVCPFDALHWSPFFEYVSYSYEGMVHELDTLGEWEHHVLPPPELVEDAEEKARDKTQETREKWSKGVWAVIREEDKREAYLQRHAARTQPAQVAPPPGPQPVTPQAPAAQAAPTASEAPSAETAQAEPQAPAESAPAAEPAKLTEGESTAPPPPGPHADPDTIPRVDPMSLPDGLDIVSRARLKKLAVFQERGHAPPQDLIDKLGPVLDQLGQG